MRTDYAPESTAYVFFFLAVAFWLRLLLCSRNYLDWCCKSTDLNKWERASKGGNKDGAAEPASRNGSDEAELRKGLQALSGGKELEDIPEPSMPSPAAKVNKKKKNKTANERVNPGKKQRQKIQKSHQKQKSAKPAMSVGEKYTPGTLSLGYDWHATLSARNDALKKSFEEKKGHVPSLPRTQLISKAQKAFEEEVDAFQRVQSRDRSAEAQWKRKVLSSGTLSDKIASLALDVQESPMQSMDALDSLLSMSKKKGRREAELSIEALKDPLCHKSAAG